MVCDREQSHRNLQLQKRFDAGRCTLMPGEAALLYWAKFTLADLTVMTVEWSLACPGISENQSSV